MLKRNEQLALNIPSSEPEYSPESYIVSDSNRAVFDYIMQWPWQSRGVMLIGAKGSGKTHLAHCWQQVSGAAFLNSSDLHVDMDEVLSPYDAVIIKVDAAVEDPLLMRVYDHIEKHKKSVLLVATSPLINESSTADLKSRLNSWQMLEMPQLDDVLLETLLYKAFSAKQLDISPEVIQYLMPRISRDAYSIQQMVDAIDAASMSEKRNITVPFVKKVLEESSSLDLLEE